MVNSYSPQPYSLTVASGQANPLGGVVNMVKYATIVDEHVKDNTWFCVDRLEPLDKIRVVLEQFIFGHYISLVCPCRSGVNHSLEVWNNAQELATHIQPHLASSVDRTKTNLYNLALTQLRYFQEGKVSSVDLPVLVSLFAAKVEEYSYNEYTPTITESFLDLWFALANGVYNMTKFTSPDHFNTEVFIPTIRIYHEEHPDYDKVGNPVYNPRKLSHFKNMIKGKEPIVRLELRASPHLTFTNPNPSSLAGESHLLFAMLNNCNYGDIQYIDDLIPIISDFSIYSSGIANNYITSKNRTLFGHERVYVGDIMHDIVEHAMMERLHGKNRENLPHKTRKEVIDLEPFLIMLKSLVERNALLGMKDLPLLVLFLDSCNNLTDSKAILNFLSKSNISVSYKSGSMPEGTYTAAEHRIFDKSIIPTLLSSSLRQGLEAANDNDADDMGEDDNEDNPADSEEQSTEEAPNDNEEDDNSDDLAEDDPADDLGEDTAGDEEEEEDEDPSELDRKPEIDPKMMMLELASPIQTISDYLFRVIVARKIDNIIKNPPENVKSSDLLILKRWKLRWLFLVSIPTLRDFLSRVSIRLTN